MLPSHSTNLAAGITGSKLTSHTPPSTAVADGATRRCESAEKVLWSPTIHCLWCWISAAVLEIEPQTPHIAPLPQSGPELWSTTITVALVLHITVTPADRTSILMAAVPTIDRLFR